MADLRLTTEYHIFYWGPGIVGRGTSMACLLGKDRGGLRGDQDYELRHRSRRLLLRYSSIIAKYWYAADDPQRPQIVEAPLAALRHVDGIVFVADSQEARHEHNLGDLERLRADLRRVDRDLDRLPVVFQFNKRDLPDLMSIEDMRSELYTKYCDYVSSIAIKGIGVWEAMDKMIELLDNRDQVGSRWLTLGEGAAMAANDRREMNGEKREALGREAVHAYAMAVKFGSCRRDDVLLSELVLRAGLIADLGEQAETVRDAEVLFAMIDEEITKAESLRDRIAQGPVKLADTPTSELQMLRRVKNVMRAAELFLLPRADRLPREVSWWWSRRENLP